MAYRIGNGTGMGESMAAGQAASDRAFRGARRHSRRVRFLRVAIPLAILLTGAGVVAMTWLNPLRLLRDLPVGFGNLVVSGTKITMESPRLAGFTKDSRAYEVSAKAAAQDLAKPDKVELQDIRAKIDMQDKSVMEMVAATGTYDSKSEMLTLGRAIVLKSSTGFEGRLSEAVVDIRKGSIVSKRPVEVVMLQGTLNANDLEVVNAGDLVRFSGGINMVLTLGAGGEKPVTKAP